MMFGRRGRVFAATRPTDMRKSYDTLARIVTTELGKDVFSGDAFLFVNARANRAKILFYDGTGLCILMKRLERQRFAAPWKRSTDGVIKMTTSELSLFLEGSQLVFVGQLSPEDVEPGRVLNEPLTT